MHIVVEAVLDLKDVIYQEKIYNKIDFYKRIYVSLKEVCMKTINGMS